MDRKIIIKNSNILVFNILEIHHKKNSSFKNKDTDSDYFEQ